MEGTGRFEGGNNFEDIPMGQPENIPGGAEDQAKENSISFETTAKFSKENAYTVSPESAVGIQSNENLEFTEDGEFDAEQISEQPTLAEQETTVIADVLGEDIQKLVESIS